MRLKNTYLYKSGRIFNRYDAIGQEMKPVLSFKDPKEYDNMFDVYNEIDDVDGWKIVRDILERTIDCSTDRHWLAWEDCALWLKVQEGTLVISTELFRPTAVHSNIMLSGDADQMIGCAIDITTQAMSVVYESGYFFSSEVSDGYSEEVKDTEINNHVRIYRHVPEGKTTFIEWSAGLMLAYMNFSSVEMLGIFGNNGGEEDEQI